MNRNKKNMGLTIAFSTKSIDPDFVSHLKSTCGVKNVEILPYENKGKFSLTEIYNKALDDSTNDIIVFSHDDIILENNNWGRKLIKHYNNSEYGLLGVAGTTHMASTGRWWEDNTKMMGRVKHTNDGKTWENKYCSVFSKEILETCCLDGVIFSCHRDRIKSRFDESVGGFHFYDIDFTFNNHLLGVKCGIIFDVRLTHKSMGMTNEEWEENRKSFVNKFSLHPKTNKPLLPYALKPRIIFRDKKLKIKNQPKVSIIIPSKDNIDLLFKCINSIVNKTQYINYEVVIADTGSNEDNKNKIKEFIKNKKCRLVEYDYYHFSEINNEVVENHLDDSTTLLLFCNDDIELLNDAVSEMVSVYHKNKKVCGTIGARLHFGDNTVQHDGVFLFSKKGNNDEIQIGLTHYGHRSSYSYTTNTIDRIGNTAAFLMISKVLFDSIGGFNENYIECLEDVELNLRCLLEGKRNLFCGNAVAYHYESQSRKTDGAIRKEDYQLMVGLIQNNKDKLSRFIPLMQN